MFKEICIQTTSKDREGKGMLHTNDVSEVIQGVTQRSVDETWDER